MTWHEGSSHSSHTSHSAARLRSWIHTRRLTDLSLYDPTTTLDLQALAYTLYLQQRDVSVPCDSAAKLQPASALHTPGTNSGSRCNVARQQSGVQPHEWGMS